VSELNLVEENTDFLVVNKSAGLITENSPFEDKTIENQLVRYLQVNNKKPYIGVVHRLDRVTSGALIFAKKKSVLVRFNELFSQRKIQKTYLAIVTNKPAKISGVLVNYLVKNQREKRADIVTNQTPDSQYCRLTYKLVGENEAGYLLEVKPSTGRFHQIRAQLAHIGCPIIGDTKYGSNQSYEPLSICLHAWKIQYVDPLSKDTVCFTAPVPKNAHWDFPKSK